MASINIKDLETAQNVNDDDFIVLEQYNGTKKVKARVFGDMTNQEVVEARGESNSLKERLGEFDSQLSDIAINVKSVGFLAIGDGITDDTEAIQRAIDSINNNANCGRIYFPAGTYLVDSLIINKANASKIIFEGQQQKMNYFSSENETVKIISKTNNNILTSNGVELDVIGISLKGFNKENCGIIVNKSRISFDKCKVYNFNNGLTINETMYYIKDSEITANINGIKLYKSGDSLIDNCYINTNKIGVYYDQYCSNSAIKGGKIEWNDIGIKTISGGLLIENIQFDFNKLCDLFADGSLYGKNHLAVYPDNVFSISFNNNRCLGSGYTDVDASDLGSCFIYLNKISEFIINGNTMTSGGRWAQDNGGNSNEEPSLGIGPTSAFIKCRDSMINVGVNNFNSQYNTIPVEVIDTEKLISEICYSNNRNLSNQKNFIYDYGKNGDLKTKQTIFYSYNCENKVFFNGSKPTLGTYNKNDRIYNNYTIDNYVSGWICVDEGTLREVNDLNVISNVGENKLTLSRDITADELKVGDYLWLGEKLKIIRIVYKDSNEPAKEIPDIFVDKIIEVNYNGTLNFLTPKFKTLDEYKGRKNIGNEDCLITEKYSVLNLQSDQKSFNITLSDEMLYDGFEFMIRCAWIINEINFKTNNLGNVGTFPASSTGWWKGIYFDRKIKFYQISNSL